MIRIAEVHPAAEAELSDTPTVESLNRPPSAGPLGHRVAAGFAWGLAGAFATKGLTMVSQLVLAWLLRPEDFGLIGLAYTVATFCTTVQGAGLTQILTQRQAQFRRWANPAFWMSFSVGLLAAIGMLIGAPIAARIYHEPRIIPLIAILAANAVLTAMMLVPTTKLQILLRFREATLLGTGQILATTGLTIALAAMGAGAYSFVWPPLLVSVPKLAILMTLTKTPFPRMKPEIRRWRHLLKDSAYLFTAAILWAVMAQGDYAILGIVAPVAVVGVFYFAFSLSMQVLSLLSANLTAVLFPVLSRIQNNADRLRSAYIRVARTLGVITIPLCLLQAVFIDSAIRVLFRGRWDAAIPVAQILSLGMALRTVGWSAGAVFQSQGRFGKILAINTVIAPIFLASVALGAIFGQSTGVAIAEALFFLLTEPVIVLIALRLVNGGVRDLLRCFSAPILVGGITAAGSGLAAQFGYFFRSPDPPRLLIGGIATAFLYPVTLRLLAASELNEITGLIKSRLRSSAASRGDADKAADAQPSTQLDMLARNP